MAIHELFEKESPKQEVFDEFVKEKVTKGYFFSTLLTRFCFFLLIVADLIWFMWSVFAFLFFLVLNLVTFSRFSFINRSFMKSLLSFRRSIVCGLALFIGLFSPPFGIMVACTYFLMYDKSGMDEVVPAPLQAQFKDIFTR